MRATGDCYEATATFILDVPLGDFLVCHGTVTGTGGEVEGMAYGHAWIEIGECVMDVSNGKRVVLPRAVYYQVGTVCDVRRYSRAEVVEAMVRIGHYGPWPEDKPGQAERTPSGQVHHGCRHGRR